MRHPSVKALAALLLTICLAAPLTAPAEDGYELWLRYKPLPAARQEQLAARATRLVNLAGTGPLAASAVSELERGLSGLLGKQLPVTDTPAEGAIVLATAAANSWLADAGVDLTPLGEEGYAVQAAESGGHNVTVVAANSERGLLYGVFALLREVQQGRVPGERTLASSPRIGLRMLNHWDNLDRSVERGYAGQSLWDWWALPDVTDPRYTDYARANASLGINGTVVNNVNAKAEILSPDYLAKVAALADAFRPWGLKIYLSVRFSSPRELGGLPTADPLDPAVRAWWASKADEIHARIPDFGGFLVKANSEGQPGPQDYGRSHAEGANMLAEALAPHGGLVLWRAFVYAPDNTEDRVRQAYSEFQPLDGQFADNVLVQVKNGPLDFQPREPFHPLFGAMPQTPLAMEFQITQEYLGFASHLAYLGSMWEEVLAARTFRPAEFNTVADVIDGRAHNHSLSAMAGVANTGSSRNWTGHPFGQANWYAFGRLAWDPRLGARDIAEEWLRQTFSSEPRFLERSLNIMLRSHQAVVDYMTPLGLAHLMGTGHHYGPAPWVSELDRPEWNPWYYHRADASGIGLDRGPGGSNAVAQYAPPLAQQFGDVASVPEELLLWFHRVPWDLRMVNGRTLEAELFARYDRGVAEVEAMQSAWAELSEFVDAERFELVSQLLEVQLREARWWRNACIAYFQHQSGRPLPPGIAPPPESLEYYQSLEFPFAPGH